MKKIAATPIDSPVGSLFENYRDCYGIDDDLIKEAKRFVASAAPLNRDAALSVIAGLPGEVGYEADALLLHFTGMDGVDNTDVTGARWLQKMAKSGNQNAQRVFDILRLDDCWAHLYEIPKGAL